MLAGDAGVSGTSHEPSERYVLEMSDDNLGKCVVKPEPDYRLKFRCKNDHWRTENLAPYIRPPLHVGKSWEHEFLGMISGTEMVLEVRVGRRETITVPAGTYETYRVEMMERQSDAEEGPRKTCWYAPAIQFFVKCKGLMGTSFELIEHVD